MKFDELIMAVLRFALSALIMALLTLAMKHGRRWFRPVKKFIRTGRWASGPNARWRSGRATRLPVQATVKEPRMTVARVLTALAQLAGQSPRADTQVRPNNQDPNNDAPLDLRF
ncbi:MAG: hypothetical protein C4583_04205 [Anaerolineaceae bacterium]|nr:MAG: hypothetical protein C4583_04205 [Anaerolineaceae bacterium]